MRRGPVVISFTRQTPRVAAPRRLSVGSPLTRNADCDAMRLAAAAPSLPRSSPATNSNPTRDSPASRSCSAAATCAARMPFASQEPRPNSRSPSTRLAKNGGTQSKCVENTSRGSPIAAITLLRPPLERLLEHRIATAAQVRRNHRRDLALAAGRRIDVDQLSREGDRIYRIHASSSVRASVFSSRYLTITGVASARPHSRPAPTVTGARARDDDGALGNDERLARFGLDDAAVRQVVDRRRSGEDRPRGDHRARA